jgi:hypothetical protein
MFCEATRGSRGRIRGLHARVPVRFKEKMDSYEDAILDQRWCSGFVRKKNLGCLHEQLQ